MQVKEASYCSHSVTWGAECSRDTVTIQSREAGVFSEDVIASAAKQSQRVEEEIATSLRSSQ